jgi:rod shape-determining protein MreB
VEGVKGLADDLAIDLGTANTLVSARGRGVVVDEPTVIALDCRTSEVVAMGRQAWEMVGRTPGHIVAVRPLRHGAITDYDVAERLIRLVLHQAGVSRLHRARVLVCVPWVLTPVERRAVEESARRAGAAEAYLLDQALAAAVGAGLPVQEPLGNMVVDVGGGTTEVAVVSLGEIVAVHALKVGGFDFDAAIRSRLRRHHGLVVGERTAEQVKLAAGAAHPAVEEVEVEVRGRDLAGGLPKTVVLTTSDVRQAMEEPVRAVIDAVVDCLSRTPPDLAQDLIEQGVHLTGGGSLLAGLDRRVADETGLPVSRAEAPLHCVARGAGRCLESFDALKARFG